MVCNVVPEGYPDFSGFISHYKVPDSSYDPVTPSKLLDFGGRNDPSNKINSLLLICNVCNLHTVTAYIREAQSLATSIGAFASVSYTHLRAHETGRNLVCRL